MKTSAAVLEQPARPSAPRNRPQQAVVAYLMSRFPKLTETFVLFEMMALERQGLEIHVYPLLRARNSSSHPEGAPLWRKCLELFRQPRTTAVMHPEAKPFVERAHYTPFLSAPIVAAQFHFLRRRPRAYFAALGTIVRANRGSLNFLLGGLAIFPKAVYFARLMQAQGVTHVHAHFANHPAAGAFIIHRLTGIPYSFTAHGADLQVDQHMLSEKVAAAARVVTISDYNREFIIAKCGEDCRPKVDVVRCGVDTSVFRPSPSDRSHREPLAILCIGTMYEVKGHRYLIEACQRLRESNIDFVCRFVGDGPCREALARQVNESGLADCVQFLGGLARREIVEQHAAADVLVAPSVRTREGRREGIPVVLIEAMASGLPVVASKISGIPELVDNGETGLLVPDRDPAALCEALTRISRDPELRQRLGAAGRAKVEREYDLFQNAARVARHFSQELV